MTQWDKDDYESRDTAANSLYVFFYVCIITIFLYTILENFSFGGYCYFVLFLFCFVLFAMFTK